MKQLYDVKYVKLSNYYQKSYKTLKKSTIIMDKSTNKPSNVNNDKKRTSCGIYLSINKIETKVIFHGRRHGRDSENFRHFKYRPGLSRGGCKNVGFKT